MLRSGRPRRSARVCPNSDFLDALPLVVFILFPFIYFKPQDSAGLCNLSGIALLSILSRHSFYGIYGQNASLQPRILLNSHTRQGPGGPLRDGSATTPYRPSGSRVSVGA